MDEMDVRKRRSTILSTLSIPSASMASEQLLELVMDEDVDLPSLAQAIQSEPGITAKIVSIANSAFFSAPCKVLTVEQAMIKVLGVQTVRSLCMGMLMGPKFKTHSCPEFSLQGYWCKALAVAQCASLLAKNTSSIDANSAYLAGLLHSIGQLLQVHHFPAEMNQLLPKFEHANNQLRLSQEREWLGIDSSEVGGWLATRWLLPREVISTITDLQDLNYNGAHWDVVRVVGYVVRFLDEADDLVAETQSVSELFHVPMQDLHKLHEVFTEVKKTVGTLAEFLSNNE